MVEGLSQYFSKFARQSSDLKQDFSNLIEL